MTAGRAAVRDRLVALQLPETARALAEQLDSDLTDQEFAALEVAIARAVASQKE